MTGTPLPTPSDRDVTVVIPTIPSRSRMLARAVTSVAKQTHPATATVITTDHTAAGAWANRNLGLLHVRTPWIAFLDDDDELLPHHLATLLELAEATETGVVWGWFEVIGGTDPIPQLRGKPYDLDDPHTVPITYLARTEVLLEAVRDVGGFQPDPRGSGAFDVQDFPVFYRMAELAGTACTDTVTWLWHHHGRNTSGLPPHIEHRPEVLTSRLGGYRVDE